MQPHRGTLILILGLVGFFCCGIVGLIAFIMGSSNVKAMQEGRMDPAGMGTTQAGRWIGLIAIILQVLGAILNFTVFKGRFGGG